MNMSDLAGLDSHNNTKTISGLETLLGDVFVTYVKVLNFHWNIKGRRFASLHEFLEEQYKYLAETSDEIAERIRVFDVKAPGSMGEFLNHASLKESTAHDISTDDMLSEISHDYGHIIHHMRTMNESVPENDYGTHTLLEDLITNFEKTRWMIKSHLE